MAAETRKQIEAALRASFIFPILGPNERERFIDSARQQSFRSGEPIFLMGDAGTSMMLVQAGEVRITYPSAEGRAVLLSELKPGAIFGEVALLDGGERSADATAGTNCSLFVFERRPFMELLRENWALTEAVLKLVCARLRRSDERMADLAFFDLPGRLAKVLLARGRPAPGGGPSRVSDTQGALAALVGGSRENVNRWLRKWEKQDLIAIAEGRITILDPDGLARVAD
jgi:CRP/FNR family transcriptional regulator, cyclic AMP receptor protein